MAELQVDESINKTSEIEEKFKSMLWTDAEAHLVGQVISGNQPKLDQVDRTTSWNKVKQNTDFSEEETPKLVETIRKIFNRTMTTSVANITDESQPEEDEYNYSVKKLSETVTKIALSALRKSGIWNPDESRRVSTKPGFRDSKRTNFSQDEQFGDEIVSQDYLSPNQGGPQVLTNISAPKFSENRDLRDNRLRKSLGHEVQHIVRAFTNKELWKGYEAESEKSELKKAGLGNPLREKHIGGFKVGSNMQGSEAIGELFATVIRCEITGISNPNISDVIPHIEKKVLDSLSKADDKKEIHARYFSANVALADHLKQLDRLGYGKLPALRLVALGSFGYTSLEKMPSLINLGIMNQEKFEKINYVIRNIFTWLTSNNAEGFKFLT